MNVADYKVSTNLIFIKSLKHSAPPFTGKKHFPKNHCACCNVPSKYQKYQCQEKFHSPPNALSSRSTSAMIRSLFRLNWKSKSTGTLLPLLNHATSSRAADS